MIHDKGTNHKYDNFPIPSSYLDIIIINEKNKHTILLTIKNMDNKPSKNDIKREGAFLRVYGIETSEKSFQTTVKIQSIEQNYHFNVNIHIKYKNIDSLTFWKKFSNEISPSFGFEDVLKNHINKHVKDFFTDIDLKLLEAKKIEFEDILRTAHSESFKVKGIEFSYVSVNIELSEDMEHMIDRHIKFQVYRKEFKIPTKNYEFAIIPDISYQVSDFTLLTQSDDAIADKFLSLITIILSNASKALSGDEYKKFEQTINSNYEILNLKSSMSSEGFNISNTSFRVKSHETITHSPKEDIISCQFTLNSKDVVNKFTFCVDFVYKIENIILFLEVDLAKRKKIIESRLKRFYSLLAANHYIFNLKDLKIKLDAAEQTLLDTQYFSDIGISAITISSCIDIPYINIKYTQKKNLIENNISVSSKTDGYRLKLSVYVNYNCTHSDNLEGLEEDDLEKILLTTLRQIIQSASYKYDITEHLNLEKHLNSFIHSDEIKELLIKNGFIINSYHILISEIVKENRSIQIARPDLVYTGATIFKTSTDMFDIKIITIQYVFKITDMHYNTVEEYKEIIDSKLKHALSSSKATENPNSNGKWHNALENIIPNIKGDMINKGIELVSHSVSTNSQLPHK